MESPIEELALLHHDSSVDNFAKHFMALSCSDTMISEKHQVQLFLIGLSKPLRTNVSLQRPATLDDVVMLARAYEQWDVPLPPPQSPVCTLLRSSSHLRAQFSSPLTPTSSALVPARGTKPALVTTWLSPTEIAQCRKDGQCFHYDEHFT
jgi:hypothetical protein